MKKLVLMLVFGLGSTTAFAYPMSGIDTRFTSSRQSVTLVDSKGNRLDLENGRAYRLRFSNQSKSFHVMAGGDHRQEIKVQGGFPGGDLKDFNLTGNMINNPGTALRGRTGSEARGQSRGYETESCSWVCRHEYVCRGRDGRDCYYRPVYCYGSTTYDVTYVHTATVFEMDVVDEFSSEKLGNFRGDVSTDRYVSSRRYVSSSCPYRYGY